MSMNFHMNSIQSFGDSLYFHFIVSNLNGTILSVGDLANNSYIGFTNLTFTP